MVQLATQAPGQPMGHTSYTSYSAYVYDVEHRGGLAMPTIALMDLETVTMPFVDMAEAVVCPVATGACVTSTAGGMVIGYDMYGQMIYEDIAAAGTSTIAFASIIVAPDDASWVNTFGLPYKRLDASHDSTNVAFTDASDTGDSRGLFTYATALAEPVEVEIAYKVDRKELFGAPYAERFASAEFDTSTMTIAGTIDATGAVSIAIPSAGPTEVPCQVSLPGVGTVYAMSGAAVNVQLPALWMNQYGEQIGDDPLLLGNLITVDPLGNEYAPVYVQLVGTVAPTATTTPAPDPAPSPDVLSAPPSSFGTHAAADAWLAEYLTVTGHDEPDEWSTQTLSEKRASAVALYEHWIADH